MRFRIRRDPRGAGTGAGNPLAEASAGAVLARWRRAPRRSGSADGGLEAPRPVRGAAAPGWRLVLLAGGLLLPVATAHAVSRNEATTYLGYDGISIGDAVFTEDHQEASGSSAAVSSSGFSSGMGGATQYAEAAAGAARARATSSTEGGYSANFSGTAIASWEDEVTVTAPGRTGPGVMQAAIEISGALNCVLYEIDYNKVMNAVSWVYADVIASPGGRVFSANASIGLIPSQQPEPEIRRQALYGYMLDGAEIVWSSQSVASISGRYVFDVPFVFGQPFVLKGMLEVAAGTQGAGGGTPGAFIESVSDFSGALAWRGVVGVRTGGGAVVTDFQFASDSGFNYVTLVPEPASGWPAAATLLALGVRAARRRA